MKPCKCLFSAILPTRAANNDGDPRRIGARERARPAQPERAFSFSALCLTSEGRHCNGTLRAYAAALPEVEAAGATLIAITPELAEKAIETGESAGVGFSIAIDKDNAFALGLVFALPEELRPLYHQIGIDLAAQNGDDSHELPIPATYVLDETGTICWAFVEADFTQRANPHDVIRALKEFRNSVAA